MRAFFSLLMLVPVLAAETSVADLGWIAGQWQGELGQASIIEVWTPALEGNMTGLFRMMRGGKVSLYELMTIEASPAGPVLRLRHFGAGLTARDDKAAEFPLKKLAGQVAVFEGQEAGGVVVTLVYRAVEGGLEVDFAKTGPKPEAVTFRFRRKPL